MPPPMDRHSAQAPTSVEAPRSGDQIVMAFPRPANPDTIPALGPLAVLLVCTRTRRFRMYPAPIPGAVTHATCQVFRPANGDPVPCVHDVARTVDAIGRPRGVGAR